VVISVVALEGRSRTQRSVVLVAYRLLLVVVLASVPVGIALAFARR
jgi:hypothetical protein